MYSALGMLLHSNLALLKQVRFKDVLETQKDRNHFPETQRAQLGKVLKVQK